MKSRRNMIAGLLAGLAMILFVGIIAGVFISKQSSKAIDVAKITKDNSKYLYHWTINSFPFWKNENEIGWLQIRCYEDDGLPMKTEYWVAEKELDSEEANSTLIYNRRGIDQGYYFGINRVIEASSLTFECYSNRMSFLAMNYNYRGPCFVLSRDGGLVADKLKLTWSMRHCDSVPLLFDPGKDEIIYVAHQPTDEDVLHEQIYAQNITGESHSLRSDVHKPYGIRYFWMHRKRLISGRIICTTFSNLDPDPDPDPKKWDMTTTTLWALPLEGNGEPEQLGKIRGKKPMLGWSISPNAKYLAAGNVGVFLLDENLHIGKKVCDLDMIHPAWSPSGHKLVGLKAKIEGKEDHVEMSGRSIMLGVNTIYVEEYNEL